MKCGRLRTPRAGGLRSEAHLDVPAGFDGTEQEWRIEFNLLLKECATEGKLARIE